MDIEKCKMLTAMLTKCLKGDVWYILNSSFFIHHLSFNHQSQ